MELIAFLIVLYLGVSPDAVSHAVTRGAAGAVRGAVRQAAATKRTATKPSGAKGRSTNTQRSETAATQAAPVSAVRAAGRPTSGTPDATDTPTMSAWDAARAGWAQGVTAARQRREQGRDAWSKACKAARPATAWAATQAGIAYGWVSGKTAGATRAGWTMYRSPTPAMASATVGAATGGTAALADMLTASTTTSTETPGNPAPTTNGDIDAGHATLTPVPPHPAPAESADATALTASSTPALDAPTATTPVTPPTWPADGGYLAVTATTAAAAAIATTTAHAKETSMELAQTAGHGVAQGGGGELASLTAIESEAQSMHAAMQSLQEALAYMGSWGASLHERWTASQWGTSDLDQGVSATADATSALAQISPEGVMAGLQQVLDGVRQAQGLAEQAASQQAYGDVTSFRE